MMVVYIGRYKLPYNPDPLGRSPHDRHASPCTHRSAAEEDSDPDFNPGVYVPEVKTKTRGKSKGKGAKRGKRGHSTSVAKADSDEEDYIPDGSACFS